MSVHHVSYYNSATIAEKIKIFKSTIDAEDYIPKNPITTTPFHHTGLSNPGPEFPAMRDPH